MIAYNCPRAQHEATRNLRMPRNGTYSGVVHVPGVGFFMPSLNAKGKGQGALYKGTEARYKGFDVIFIDEQGNWRIFIAGLDSAYECTQCIWTYIRTLE